MRIPADATTFCPPIRPIQVGSHFARTIRHTFRIHGSGDWLLLYTAGGSGLYRFPEGEFRSARGDITLYRPGAFQDYQSAPGSRGWDVLFAHFLPRPDWPLWLTWPELSDGLMQLHLHETALRRQVAVRLREMILACVSSRARGETFAQNALEEVLLWCDSINPRREEAPLDPRIGRAMDFLTEHMSEPFSEERLARASGLSASRLRHLFQRQTGDSPRRFQERQRLRKASNLLSQSRQTIGEIALEVGFANPFYFTLRFKKETGENPRAYRLRTTRHQPSGLDDKPRRDP